MQGIEYREQADGDILVICYGIDGILWEGTIPADEFFPDWEGISTSGAA